jgi:hypothetical protein
MVVPLRNDWGVVQTRGDRRVKKFVISAGAMLAFVTMAHAADLPRPQPVYEQPAFGRMPIGRALVGKSPVGKAPVYAPGPVVRRGY